MRLIELKKTPHSNGTYVGLRVLPTTVAKVIEHCNNVGIPIRRTSHDRRMHCTVLYSKVPCPDIELKSEVIHTATASGYSMFNNSAGEQVVLVLRLNAPSVVARHLELMGKHGATYDFPNYAPHVTLTHDFKGDFNALPPVTFPIYLGQEYVEELAD